MKIVLRNLEERRLWSLVASLLIFVFAFALSTGAVNAQDDNLKAAKTAFGLSDNVTVISASEATSDLRTVILDCAEKASDTNPIIVHVSSGSYSIRCTSKDRLAVPKNVILVAESGVTFSASNSDETMVLLRGAVYGGTYDGKNKAKSVIKLACDSTSGFKGVNGIVNKVNVTNAKKNGITILGSNCRNAQIKNSTVTRSQENGISAERNSHCLLIENCTCNNNGLNTNGSGINLSHSDVGTIKQCTLKDNGDKGISTNSDKVSSAKQTGCKIGKITSCTISGNKQNGVYIKPKCSLGEFSNNTVVNNKDGLVANGKTAAGTKGTSTIKNVKNNIFTGNTNSNIAAQWSGATVNVGDNNTVNGNNKSKNSIIAYDAGVIKITGKNNKIFNAKKAGISVSGKNSKLYITGKNNKIYSNKDTGIYANGGKKNAIVKITGSGNQIYQNKKSGIGLYDKAQLTITGKGTKILKNGGYSVYAKGKGTKATLKKVRLQAGKKAYYSKGGATIKKK